MRMKAEYVIFGISALLSALSKAWGDGCSDQQTFGAPVLNVCQQSNVILDLLYLSMTSATMGSNTRCECTLRSKTPGMTTSTEFLLQTNDSHVSKCDQSLIQITLSGSASSSGTPTFTCTSPRGSYFYTGNTTSDVTVTLTRRDTTVGVSYCLQVLPDRRAENDFQLTCNIGTTVTQTTSTSISPPSTTPSSNLPSAMPSSSSHTTYQSLTSSLSSTSSAGPSTSSTASEGKSVTASSYSTYSTVAGSNSNSKGEDFQVGPIAGGVSGAVVVIIIIIIIVVVVIVCKRRRGLQKSSRPAMEHVHANPAYSAGEVVAMETETPRSKTSSGKETPSSSQTRSLDRILAPSGNPYELEEEMPPDNGAVSNTPAEDSAVTKTNGSQPPNPAANLYAVVNKPKGRQLQKPPPEKPQKPRAPSTSANGGDVRAAPTGDEYAVVDKTRKKGGNAKEKSSLPSTEATPPPVPPSPGLQYADLEEVRGEGRRPAPPRPPANMATGTEYAEIDHQATARFSTEA